MKNARLYQILAMIVASNTLGARGLVCGPCEDTQTHVVPILPPSADGGVEDVESASLEALCDKYCIGAIDCAPTTIRLENGGAMPALECTTSGYCAAGRRPAGLEAAAWVGGLDATAGWLAQAAFLESASINAFRLLRRDLRAFRAPKRLLRAASRACRDEQRHARQMRALARRRGIQGQAQRVASTAVPSLESLAVENVKEGCVRETFGALVALWQASSSNDRDVRAAMKRIAADEARHAALAWQIDAWARRRLHQEARDRLTYAAAEAFQALRDEITQAPHPNLVRHIGLPQPQIAHKLLRDLAQALGLAQRQMA